MRSLPDVRDWFQPHPDWDVARLRILERHPLYRFEETDDHYHTYRHRLTGARIRYDEHHNEFDLSGGILPRIRDQLPARDDTSAERERYVFAADSLAVERLRDRLEDSDYEEAWLKDDEYRGEDCTIFLADDTLDTNEVAVEVDDMVDDVAGADIFRRLDWVAVERHRGDDEPWIRMDTAYNPYTYLEDYRRWDEQKRQG